MQKFVLVSRVGRVAHPFAMPSFEPELVWGLFLRAVGVVYFVAFSSLRRDIVPLAGRNGISPLAPQLIAIKRDFPGLRRFLRFPTLFWFGASDRRLVGGTILGMILAGLAIAGVQSGPALIACWLLYLSYALALDFFYPWDAALLEVGALSVFMPALLPLPELAVAEAPFAPVAWAYRWLLFRIVFGFGKYKFFGPGKLHFDYLKSFLVSQPLSTPLALFFAKRLPKIIFVGALGALFIIEVPTPFLIFGPPSLRLFAMGAIAALMIGIQLSGNFGFFNLIALVLCIPLLDVSGSVFDVSLAELIWPLDHAAASLFVAFLFVVGLVSLPFNSWIAQAWTYWPALDRMAGVRVVASFLCALAPFRLVHAFGVFSPESGPPMKWVVVIEGTRDGVTWKPYRYRYMPSGPDSPGRFVAPFMPRLDHMIIYDALGISLTNFLGSVTAVQNPYRFSRSGWMERLAQRLLEGRSDVRPLFLHDPFEHAPPIAVRARLKNFELDPSGEHVWRIHDVGTHMAEQRLDKTVFERWLPSPELFHWDERRSRRQSATWRQRMARPEDEAQLARLFDELVPIVQTFEPAESGALERVSSLLERRFRLEERDALEALTARIAWRLAKAFEHADADESWFDLGLLAHDAILRGRPFVERALEHPSDALETLRPVSFSRGVRLWAAFRPEVLRFQARKARVREMTLRGAAREPHPIVPGFLRHLPELGRYFHDPTEAIVPYERTEHGWVSARPLELLTSDDQRQPR